MTDPNRHGAGWQKKVAPPPAGSRPGGLPRKPVTSYVCSVCGAKLVGLAIYLSHGPACGTATTREDGSDG